MTEKGYNGWTNYETWCVSLWLNNDQGTQERCEEMAQEAWNDAEAGSYLTRLEVATRALAGILRDEQVEIADDLVGTSSMFSDLLTAAMGEVNWDEVAKAFLECVDTVEA